MTGCATPCPREQISQSTHSPGPLQDNEVVCRAAYDMHFKPSGDVKRSLVKNADLMAGTLSVWRLKSVREADTLIAAINSTQTANRLRRLYVVPTSLLRKVARKNGARGASVLDDTDCGGGIDHPDHAVIAPCQSVNANETDEDYQLIKNEIITLFVDGAYFVG